MTLHSVGRGLRTVGGATVHSRGSALAAEPFNRCPPFDQWELSGGAYLENGELVVPPGANGGVALSPPIAFPSGPRGSMRLAAEALLSGGDRRHWTALYLLNGVASTETSQGNSPIESEGVWHDSSWTIDNLTNGSTHVRWRIDRSALTAPTQRFRRPHVTVGTGSASWAPYGRVTPVVKNLLTHPVPGTVGWTRNSAATSNSIVSSPTWPGGSSPVLRSQVVSPNPYLLSIYAVGHVWNGGAVRVVSGRQYTASVWGMSPVYPARSQLRVNSYSGTSQTGSQQVSPDISMAPGVWTRVSFTVTAPPTADTVQLMFDIARANGANTAPGDEAYVTDAMVTEGPTLHDWFHGSTPPDALYTYAWSGTPGVSSSYRLPVLPG